METLQIKLQRGLSCRFSPYSKSDTQKSDSLSLRYRRKTASFAAYTTVKYKIERFYSELQTLKQTKRIKLKLANRLFLKTNAHLRKVHPKALKLALTWEAHKKQVKL